jgi:8-oxo-dGTP diphosphatase
MIQLKKIIKILERDRIRNINILNFIQDYRITSIDQVGDSLMIRGFSDRDWVYYSSQDEAEMKILVGFLTEEDHFFAAVEEWMKPIIPGANDPVWDLVCEKLYWPVNQLVPSSNENVIRLKPDMADYIFMHYKYSEFVTSEYIRERINMGPALGIMNADRLIAWIMTQDDGAIGGLEVLPEFQRKGLGQTLTLAMIKQLMDQDKLSFVHIEPDNEKSMRLALKNGFVQERQISWFERRR